MLRVLIDAVFGHHAAYAGNGIDICVPADDRSGIKYGIAADLNVIAEHGAEFFPSGLDLFIAVLYYDERSVALNV